MYVPAGSFGTGGTGRFLAGIDLRDELGLLFSGSYMNDPISRYGIMRMAKLGSNGEPIPCTCIGELDKSPDPSCPRCRGEGHMWKEYWVQYYKMLVSGRDALSLKKRHADFGLIEVPFVLVYFMYDTVRPVRSVKKFDRFIEVETDNAGSVVTPINRTEFWDINTVQSFTSRRVEYWRIACRNESLWTDADYQT